MSCCFDIALRLATGELVTVEDAKKALHSTAADHQEAAPLDRVARIKARNTALRDAANALGTDGGAWVLAGILAGAIHRFEARIWPRIKLGLPCELPPSDTALYKAYLTGLTVPKTQRRLYDLLA